MFEGPLKLVLEWFNNYKLDGTYYIPVIPQNTQQFYTDILSFIKKQAEKAKNVA